jgi:hypothetical protein
MLSLKENIILLLCRLSTQLSIDFVCGLYYRNQLHRASCSDVATLGSGGQGVFLPRHMDDSLLYGLTINKLWVMFFSYGCVHPPSNAEVGKIIRRICIEFNKISLIEKG